ncbi:MAG: hypothetical protein ACLFOY_09275 [Desulfatibacillaceae bacterium]
MDEDAQAPMNYQPSSLWGILPDGLERRLDDCLDRAPQGARVFFRADDVGAPGKKYRSMMEVFLNRRVPLSPAVVPVWLNESRVPAITKDAVDPGMFCWHQHGYRHKNHEAGGKKMEFGDGRGKDAVVRDVARGMERLYALLRGLYRPVFTPPWNRCGEVLLGVLSEFDFAAVSRTPGARPAPPVELRDIPVNVDLHTRKEPDPERDWGGLFAELAAALESGTCGVMLHHQRMNDNAVAFLDLLCARLSRKPGVELAHLGHLAGI